VLHGRRIAIIPDKDEAGRKHAQDVAGRLHGKVAEVKIVELPGGGKDATDFIEAGEQDGHTQDEIRESFLHLSETAAPWTPAAVATDAADSEDDERTAALATLTTDVGNAARLVRRHGMNLRYCAPWGKWVAWDGVRWCPDSDLQVRGRQGRLP
jgi:putative DNA primase/helicase